MSRVKLHGFDVGAVVGADLSDPIRELKWISFRPMEVIAVAQDARVSEIPPEPLVAPPDDVVGVQARVVGCELLAASLADVVLASARSLRPKGIQPPRPPFRSSLDKTFSHLPDCRRDAGGRLPQPIRQLR